MLNLDNPQDLQAAYIKLEIEFKSQIMPLSADLGEDSRSLSYLTEMHKQMRLLKTELMFLQSVKQPDKVRSRLSNIRQCLEKLGSYCQNVGKS